MFCNNSCMRCHVAVPGEVLTMENMLQLVESFTGLTGYPLYIATVIISVLVLHTFIMCMWSVFKRVGGL